MSPNEIIAMATEAGLNSYRIAPGEALAVWERFAALVRRLGSWAVLELHLPELGIRSRRRHADG